MLTQWYRVVLDEGQYIRNRRTRKPCIYFDLCKMMNRWDNLQVFQGLAATFALSIVGA